MTPILAGLRSSASPEISQEVLKRRIPQQGSDV